MTRHAPLYTFHGGLLLDDHKAVSSETAIRPAPLPARLYVPLRQSTRATPRVVVRPGQHVLKGECLAVADDPLGTAVHAPTSGRIHALADHPLAHPSGLNGPCVVIDSDGDDRWTTRSPLLAADATANPHGDALLLRTQRQAALAHLRDAGVVGLGGACFPAHAKFGDHWPAADPERAAAAVSSSAPHLATLIINGAECEPWITCDDRLMRERAAGIVDGAWLMAQLAGAARVLIGIEDNKPAALAAMRAATEHRMAQVGDAPSLQVVAIPTRYPSGSAKQLIRVLTGLEIPHGHRSPAYGVQCFNVATAWAAGRALRHGEPLISRIVTLTGNVAHPGNHEVLIGTPLDAVLPAAGPYADTRGYVLGGPMMGFALSSPRVALDKGSNCIIALGAAPFAPRPPEQACIRCSACAEVCPAELQPQQLYWHARARQFDQAAAHHVFDCIECGCCDYVCPAHIPLVDYFRFAKGEIDARRQQTRAADEARHRFEARQSRLARDKAEKAARLAARAASSRPLAAETPAPVPMAPAAMPPAIAAATATTITAADTMDGAGPAGPPPVLPAGTETKPQPQAQADSRTATPPSSLSSAALPASSPSSPAPTAAPAPTVDTATPADAKKALIAAAMARAKAQRAAQAARPAPAPPPSQEQP